MNGLRIDRGDEPAVTLNGDWLTVHTDKPATVRLQLEEKALLAAELCRQIGADLTRESDVDTLICIQLAMACADVARCVSGTSPTPTVGGPETRRGTAGTDTPQHTANGLGARLRAGPAVPFLRRRKWGF